MRQRTLHPPLRQGLTLALAISLTSATLISPSSPIAASAQESTPAVAEQPPDPFAGVTLEPLGSIAPSVASDYGLSFIRIIMEPGAEIPAHHHPGAVVLYIQDGMFSSTFSAGEGQITQASHDGTPSPTEPVAAGDELLMEPGDVLTYEGAVHTMGNPGNEPLVLLATVLLDADQPAFIFAMDMGTPTP
jgi:quercetin dioxygenase-like cupin family protein